MQSINTIALKNGKGLKIGTNEDDTIQINNRGGGGGGGGRGHFERLNILEILKDSYSAYRDFTIKSKFLKNIFLLFAYSQYKFHS